MAQALARKTQSTDLNRYGVDESVWNALKNSLYPGARDESVVMVLDYCKAAKLDPMQKPVHIVPMNVRDIKTNSYAWRDVVMPGIGLYRTQASRSGQYAGVSEPEYGEDVTTKLGNKEITYPKWCKVTVKKLMTTPTGEVIFVDFTAKEFWLENYATKGKDKQTGQEDQTPNAMWAKRPYAQLAKCAEAQALRKAFPELIGAQPTAEEMEGKTIDSDDELINIEVKSNHKGVSGLKQRLEVDNKNDSEPSVMTNMDVMDQMEKATNKEDLDLARDLVNSLPEWQQPELKTFYFKKLKEIRKETTATGE